MRLSQLRSFDAVAATGGFTAAARSLGVRQPTVSEQVSGLESEYGVTLVDRRDGKTLLTPLGERLREISLPLFALEAEARRVLESAHRLDGIELRLGADAPVHAVPLIAGLRERLPDARVRLGSGNAAELLQRLRSGDEDVIIAAGIPHADDLVSVVVDRQSLVAVVHVDNPLAHQKSVGLRRLLPEHLVLREQGSASRAALEAAAASVQDEALDATLVVDTREGALAAVAAGLGVAVIAENELLDDPRLVMVDIRDPAIPIEERMICRASEQDSAICAALFDLVAEH
ncbi:LysR family transcriptional regulator [Humibacter antri]